MNIASLEDDLSQARFICHLLEQAGHSCASFQTAKALLAVLQKSQPFDLLLIDWELPDLSGLEVLRWVRSNLGYDLPIMFITQRSGEEHLVEGLQAGADDYMVKPIRGPELLARVNALTRRQRLHDVNDGQSFELGPYRVDASAKKIYLNGQEIALARKEYDLAALFLRNPSQLFSREVISNFVWNREIPATSRTIDTHLSNIRQKLNLRPANGVRLVASYALGYRLELIEDITES